jgi:electron transfer DM13
MTIRGFWRGLILFLFGGVVGTGFGMLLGFFLFPFVFPPPPAAEQLSEADRAPAAIAGAPAATTSPAPVAGGASSQAAQASLVAAGSFIHANPSDPIHWGKGKVSVHARAVFLEPDFEVGPGPAFHVYLVPKPNIRREADVSNTMYVDLGRLRAFKGSQRYPIPAGVDLKNYPSVVIWCERFSVLISPADLTAAR